MSLWINLAGLALAAFIIWWFWLWRPANSLKASGRAHRYPG